MLHVHRAEDACTHDTLMLSFVELSTEITSGPSSRKNRLKGAHSEKCN